MLAGEFIQNHEARHCDEFLLRRWADEFEGANAELRKTLLLEVEARLRRLAMDHPAGQPIRPRPATRGIESALAFVHQNYREDIHIADVAEAAGWHEKYLLRAFKGALGMTVGQYLARLRVFHAQWLLSTTELNVVDVAFQSGFQSLGPFYQAFGRLTRGVRPLDYRNRFHRLDRVAPGA